MTPLTELGAAAAAITATLGLLVLLYAKVIRPAARLVRHTMEFLEDWRGTEARPGVEPRAGVMERLSKVEHQTERAEFHLGNGNPVPMRSLVEGTDASIQRMERRVADIEQTVETHHPTAPSAPERN